MLTPNAYTHGLSSYTEAVAESSRKLQILK